MIVVQLGYYSAPRFVPGLDLPVTRPATISIRICGV